MKRIVVGSKVGGCVECPDIAMIGAGGLWPQCMVTKTIIPDVSSRPKDCPYINRRRDAGDSLLDTIMSINGDL